MPPWIKTDSKDELVILSAHTIEAVGKHKLMITARGEDLAKEIANFTINVRDNDYPVFENAITDTRL